MNTLAHLDIWFPACNSESLLQQCTDNWLNMRRVPPYVALPFQRNEYIHSFHKINEGPDRVTHMSVAYDQSEIGDVRIKVVNSMPCL